jgi:hypothetical protein
MKISSETGTETQSIGVSRRQNGSIRFIIINTESQGDVMKLFFDEENQIVQKFQDAYTTEELLSIQKAAADSGEVFDLESINHNIRQHLDVFLASKTGQQMLQQINTIK